MQYIQNPEFFVDLGHEKVTSVSMCYVLYGNSWFKGIRFYHGIILTITKLIDFYSKGIITLLFATVFN